MSDASLQLELDPQSTNRRILIEKSEINGALGVNTNYFCLGGVEYPGKARWIQTTSANTDAQKAVVIRAALAIGP